MEELELEDLGDVFEEVFEARSKWYNIGLRLKVPVGSLETIKGENDDAADCLREMLKISLKSISHKLTWVSLVEALKSQTVGELPLADRVKTKYCSVKHGVSIL